MKNTPKMTEVSEQRLMQTLEKVASLVNEEMHPTEAIAKAASEMKVPAGHIHLLVNAYNTGRTTAQRQLSDHVWDKAASFPLADAKDVLNIMYPEKVKSAAQMEIEKRVSDDYSRSPRVWLQEVNYENRKAAAKVEGLPELPGQNEPKPEKVKDHKREHIAAIGKLQRMEKVARDAYNRTDVAFGLVNQTAAELADYFKASDSRPYHEVKDNCLQLHGDAVRPLFAHLEEFHPVITKQAKSNRFTAPANGKPYELVLDALEAKNSYEVLKQDWEVKDASARELRDQIFPPMKEKTFNHPVLGDMPEKKAGFIGSAVGLGPGLAHNVKHTGSILGPLKGKVEKMYEGYKGPAVDPQYDAELDKIRQRSIVQDLLTGEFSEHDPHEVIKAVKDIGEIAPNVAMKPAILRDFISKRVAGGPLSYFDLDALTRIEKNLLDAKQMERNLAKPELAKTVLMKPETPTA